MTLLTDSDIAEIAAINGWGWAVDNVPASLIADKEGRKRWEEAKVALNRVAFGVDSSELSPAKKYTATLLSILEQDGVSLENWASLDHWAIKALARVDKQSRIEYFVKEVFAQGDYRKLWFYLVVNSDNNEAERTRLLAYSAHQLRRLAEMWARYYERHYGTPVAGGSASAQE